MSAIAPPNWRVQAGAFRRRVCGLVTIGGVRSKRIVTLPVVSRPAPLVAVHRYSRWVSNANVIGSQPVHKSMPDSGSESVQLRVTGVRCHPDAGGGGVCTGTTIGGVSSILNS